MQLEIPQINTWSTVQGVSEILSTLASTHHQQGEVTLCFNNCRFISAEVVAILAGLKLTRDRLQLQTNVDVNSLCPAVEKFLGKSKFLDLFGHARYKVAGNSLPVYIQHELDKEGILRYIDQEIFARDDMPEMTDALHKEIRKAFFELFGNIFTHSESQIGGLVCGQVYPKMRRIQIVFYDGGIGLASRVRETVPSINSDAEAVEWALRRGNSTLSNHGASRGLGLYLLRQFLRVSEGKFRIYANQSVFEEIKDGSSFQNCAHSINGTLIDMRINVRGNITYAFSYEEN